MDKKRIVLLGCALASAGTLALFVARHYGGSFDEVRHAHRVTLDEPRSGDPHDETSLEALGADNADHAPLAKPAAPKADQPREAAAQPDSESAAPARYAAPQTSDELRAAAEAVRYVPLKQAPDPQQIAADRQAAATGSPGTAPAEPTELEPAVLNGDRPTQLRQYVAMQQSIERATLKLEALPEDAADRVKLTAFVAETRGQLAEADRLLQSKKPAPSELAGARAELDRLTAQSKPMPGAGH
jgi:hypothetical protein